MQDNSDQFATPEEEAAFHEEVIVSDSPQEAEETEEPEESTDSNDEPSEPEKVTAKKTGYIEFSPEQKARVDEITRKRYEAERKAQALEKEIAQYRKPPEPPKEVPVPYADPITEPEVFARQQQDRDKYIREHTKFEADAEARSQQEQAKEQVRVGSLIDKYNKNMETLGVNPKSVKAASAVLVEAGIGKELTEFLLEDDEGPALVAYLGSNLDDAEAVIGMTPTKAALYIERNIRSKLKSKPVSKAPAPPLKVNGTRKSAQASNGWEIS
jgi:hypothetical protein